MLTVISGRHLRFGRTYPFGASATGPRVASSMLLATLYASDFVVASCRIARTAPCVVGDS